MIRILRMNPQPTRESDRTPWRWCRPGCHDKHDWCVTWWGNVGILVAKDAPPGPGPCVAAKRKRGVWWWVFRFDRPAKHTCDTCRHWSGLVTAWDLTPLGGDRMEGEPPYFGWCIAMRAWTRSTDGPWIEHPDNGCEWEALG